MGHNLLKVASQGNLEKLKSELGSLPSTQGAHTIKDASGRNALHVAAHSGHAECARHLLDTPDLKFTPHDTDAQGDHTHQTLLLLHAAFESASSMARCGHPSGDGEIKFIPCKKTLCRQHSSSSSCWLLPAPFSRCLTKQGIRSKGHYLPNHYSS